MNNRLLHTPEGVRDIYGKEYARKLAVEQKLQNAIHCFGYEDIQTPSIEFFDVFSKEIGTTPSKELYKFFDKEGNTLVQPNISWKRRFLFASVITAILLPTHPIYRVN